MQLALTLPSELPSVLAAVTHESYCGGCTSLLTARGAHRIIKSRHRDTETQRHGDTDGRTWQPGMIGQNACDFVCCECVCVLGGGSAEHTLRPPPPPPDWPTGAGAIHGARGALPRTGARGPLGPSPPRWCPRSLPRTARPPAGPWATCISRRAQTPCTNAVHVFSQCRGPLT